MTWSPGSVLLIELTGPTAEKTRWSTTSDGTDTVQSTVLTSPPQSCLLVLPGAAKPSDGDAGYQGPTKRENGHCHENDGKKTLLHVLFFLTGQGPRALSPPHPRPLSQ